MKNHVKGEEIEIEIENGRDLVSMLMTNQGIVITRRIGTTEIETETGIRRETGGVIVTADVIVVVTVTVTMVEIVLESLNAIEIGAVIGSGTALKRGRGIGQGVIRLGTPTKSKGLPLIIGSMITTAWDQNMRGIDMVRGGGSMSMLSQKKIIRNGMERMIMGISVQKLSTTKATIISQIAIRIHMIQWKTTAITLLMEVPLRSVEGLKFKIWTMNMGTWRGQFLATMNSWLFCCTSQTCYAS